MYITGYHNKEQMIYSRNRIRIPKIQFKSYRNNEKKPHLSNKKKKALIKLLVILIIAIVVVKNMINAINPIVKSICADQAKSIATVVSNEQASIVMEKYSYEDLATVIKDDDGRIQMIKLNIVPVNQIISEVALAIQEELDGVENANFGIRLGSFTGSTLLSGSGPYVKVKMSTVGTVETDLKSEFKTAGINQTLHQIYLDVHCNVSILTPFDSTTEEIKNQILIAESIIVGEIPNSYYNFTGVDSRDTLEVVE